MMFLPLAVAGLAASTSFHARIEAWLQDAAQRMAAGEQHFDDVMVVAIDEGSLSALRPYLGGWPYARDIYAAVLDYLGEMRVKAVFFDLVFADARPGDQALRAALARNPEAVLGAAAQRGGAVPPGGQELLGGLAWRAEGDAELPAMDWDAVVVPASLLEGMAPVPRVGLISFAYDADGFLRRIPLLHRVAGHYLPSAALAMLSPAEPPRLRRDGERLLVGEAAWPVGADGMVSLRYPASAGAVRVMPFEELAAAALGLPGRAIDAAELRGKTLYIGATALSGDNVNTPIGVLNGVHLLAIAHGALQRGLYLAPPSPGWNAVLLLCGMLPVAAALAARNARQPAAIALAAGVAAFAVIVLLHLLLLARQQASWLGLPFIVALTASLLAVLHAQHRRAGATVAAARHEVERQQQTLAFVSHELKSPLAAIDLTLQNLGRVGDLPESVQLRHQRIQRASRRLQALVAGNLAADRLRRDDAMLRGDVFDLGEVVAEAVEAAERPGIAVDRPPSPAAMFGERELIRIACDNLVGNAVKYSPLESPIQVSLARDGDCWELRVRDSGCGIAAAEQARIFEPYVRAAGARQPGSGLGLALVRQIVERHRGEVAVQSMPGQGACFIVRLPAGVHS